MVIKSGLFLFVLAVLQVSAYKIVEPDFDENEINPQAVAVSSSASRIVSGWAAQPGQLPHHATLRMVNPTGTITRGGGAIVSRQWVITTAFVLNNRVSLIVRAGVLSLSNNNPENIFETTEWHHHPRYNNLTTQVQTHDIGLVKLQRPVVYSGLLQPIRVQPRADAYRNYDGQQVYASGYATTASGAVFDVLRGVYLRAISNSACARIYPQNLIIDSTICAQFFNITSQSVCAGDPGLPLVHVGFDGVPTLIGVYSFYPAGCPLGLPNGFVRPGPYLSWFREVTGLDFENLREDTTTTSTSTTTTTTSTSTTTATTPTTTTTTPITTTTPTTTTTTIPTTTPSTTTTTAPTTTTSTTTPATTTTSTPTTSTSTTTPSTSTTTTITPITTPTTSTITTTPTSTTTPSTSTTTTTITPSTTTISSISTTSSTTAMTTASETPEPEDFNPEEDTTASPGESEDKEEDDTDSSECNDDDEMVQLQKRLEVNVKVKVGFNKYISKDNTAAIGKVRSV